MSEEYVDSSKKILISVICIVFTILVSVIGYLYISQGSISDRVLVMESMSTGYVDIQSMSDRILVLESSVDSYGDERMVVYNTVEKEMERLNKRVEKVEGVFVLKLKSGVIE